MASIRIMESVEDKAPTSDTASSSGKPISVDVLTDENSAVELTKDEVVHEGQHRHVGSIADTFKSGAAIAGKVLLHLGLDARYRARKGSMPHTQPDSTATDKALDREKEDTVMVSTPFLPLSTALLMKQGIAPITPITKASHEMEKDIVDKHNGVKNQFGKARAPVVGAETATVHVSKQFVDNEVPEGRIAIHRRGHQFGLKSRQRLRSRPDRLVQRIYSFSPTKFVHEASLLVKDDSMTGKLAMVLMSTICGVGVGMFGALLFVVALKVRLFQTRRRGQHQGATNSHQTAVLQLQTHQQFREQKKVIPRGILDSFGVQTVLQTSTTTIMTKTIVKSDVSMFTKIKLAYAEDVIEMEEGFEDLADRENARRQRLRTRTSHLFPRPGVVEDLTEGESVELGMEQPQDGGNPELDGSFEEESEVTPATRGYAGTIPVEGTMDLERITTAIMTATRRGSYRRSSQSRQMQTEQDLSSTTNSVSSSLSLSLSSAAEEKPKRCCGEKTAEREKELPFANANAQTMCAICLGEYEVGDQVRTLPCYHQYHLACIDPWLLTVASFCPICKRDLWPGSA
ncbi:hypothetical protein BGX28_006102 [Mortierella sp. GBA30]|nr:hypothetical protein BGX28_006102 [Mortierella sp. GBA30]